MTAAVAYLRVSGASQIDGTGFDRQLEACTRLARDQGFHLTQVFREEAVSGTKEADQRPAFQAMVAYMLDSDSKIVVIESLDRLARMYQVSEQLLLYLAAKDLALWSANTGENVTAAITADPMKKAMVQIQGIFAELDKSLIVAKLRKGRERTKSNVGRCEGRKPFGHYENEVAAFARMRDLRASGIIFSAIAMVLNEEGFASRSGGPWHTGTIAKIMGRERVSQNCAFFAPPAPFTTTDTRAA